MADVLAPLEPLLPRLGEPPSEADGEAWQSALRQVGVPGLLVALGQRVTPASLRDARGVPPGHDELLNAARTPHSDKDPLSVGARALAKHAARHPDPWWGEVTGSTQQKSAAADEVIQRILGEPTWWNVFEHYAHGIVFEARCPSGHGVRWGHDGSKLIGFLEPFDESLGGVGRNESP